MKITNTSRALQGVHSTNGLVFLEAGETRDIDVAKDYVERVKSLPYFAIGDAPKPGPGSHADNSDAIATRDAEITTLKDRVAELELAAEASETVTGLPTKLEATHRGRGSFSIMDAKELVEGLDKDAADKFNALSDEDKAKFVTEAQKSKAA